MRAVLFDLDGTLLDIDMDTFLRRYMMAIGPVVAEVTGGSPAEGVAAIMAGTDAMCGLHPGQTNQQVFAEAFATFSGVELDDGAWTRFARFYAEEFPALGADLLPRAGARAAVQTAIDLGLRVAIATNPIFPREAVAERMRWAGVADIPVDLVTTYESMGACKPHAAYFRETAELLGTEARECLMVGDDPVLDMSAADAGMRTYYVGPAPAPPVDWSGDLEQLAQLLDRLAAQDD